MLISNSRTKGGCTTAMHDLLGGSQRTRQRRLATLPTLSVRRFVCHRKFSSIFRHITRVPRGMPVGLHGVVSGTVRHSSGPSLTVRITVRTKHHNISSMPALLGGVFSHIL